MSHVIARIESVAEPGSGVGNADRRDRWHPGMIGAIDISFLVRPAESRYCIIFCAGREIRVPSPSVWTRSTVCSME